MSDQPYQLLPALSEEEYAALRDDIAANGIRVPVDVDEGGQVLDGHHRQAIAADLGIPCPTRVVGGLTEDDKRAHALAVNLQRRTLTREQRRALIDAELEYDPSRSDRAIGRLVGVDHKTVGAIRRGGWGIPHPDPSDLSPAEARELTDRIRDQIEQAQQDLRHLVDALFAEGKDPAEVITVVALMERKAYSKLGDDWEVKHALHKVLVEPTIAYIGTATPGGGAS